MSYFTKPVNISSLGIKRKSYHHIQTPMDENELAATDIKGKPTHVKQLFGMTQKMNTQSQPTRDSSKSKGDAFCVNLRGKQGKMTTLRNSFTMNSTVKDVALSYKEQLQECVEISYEVEHSMLMSRNKVLQHHATLAYYGIVSSNNLITLIFKTKGGSDWFSRTVQEWDADDLKSWILTLHFDPEVEKHIILGLDENGFTGSDLKDATIEEIADALDIEEETAQKLSSGLRDWKASPPDESNDDQSSTTASISPLHYYVGYFLDCKDSEGKWRVSQVIGMNRKSITVKHANWPDEKTNSGYCEDSFDRAQLKTHCAEFGVRTNQNNNKDVYQEKKRPSKKQAKSIRDKQKAQLQSSKKSDGGIVNSFTSLFISRSSNKNNDNNTRSGVYGIVGLVNLGNQCYMNSAIQLIVNTPSLLQLFHVKCTAKRESLLYHFQTLCKQAHQSVYKPRAIKKMLAREDCGSFGDYSQQDAGHALSVLLEILDRELLNNESHESSGVDCTFGGGLGQEDEQNVIEKIMSEYNPNHQSVIRDSMTFVLRETYECMTPNCDYMETRYNYVQKLVLPLKSH
eukprot:920146_1